MNNSKESENKIESFDFNPVVDTDPISQNQMSDWDENIQLISSQEELYKENFPELPTLVRLKDVSDSIKESVLLEHQSHDNYYSHSDVEGIFDSNKYEKDSIASKENNYKYIIKVPSRSSISNENSFSISMKCFKTDMFRSENLLAKIISDNFIFSKSMFELKEIETLISLTKKKNFRNYKIRIKIYYNNEVVQEGILDLYKRSYGE